MPPKQEAELLNPVIAYVRRKTFIFQQEEMQFYEHRIDLYGFSPARNLTIAIELKLEKWRKAFEQALRYQLCSDLVYIAVPPNIIPKVDKELLREHGIGLIAVADSGRCRQVVAPSSSPVLRQYYRRTYVQILKDQQCPL